MLLTCWCRAQLARSLSTHRLDFQIRLIDWFDLLYFDVWHNRWIDEYHKMWYSESQHWLMDRNTKHRCTHCLKHFCRHTDTDSYMCAVTCACSGGCRLESCLGWILCTDEDEGNTPSPIWPKIVLNAISRQDQDVTTIPYICPIFSQGQINRV